MPQSTWLLDRDGKVIVDKIYRVEDLEELRRDFLEDYGVDLNPSRVVNKSEGETTLEDLMQNETLLKRLNKLFESDFRLLCYPRRIPIEAQIVTAHFPVTRESKSKT